MRYRKYFGCEFGVRLAYLEKQYTIMVSMIRSFRCRDTERLANDEVIPRFRSFERVARRKLELLTSATTLQDLRSPPGNRLEALRGNRAGQFSIRINDQWRICFSWRGGGAVDVEIVDYH